MYPVHNEKYFRLVLLGRMKLVQQCFSCIILEKTIFAEMIPLKEMEADIGLEESRNVTEGGEACLGVLAVSFATRRCDLAESLLLVFVLPSAESLEEAPIDLVLALTHLMLEQDVGNHVLELAGL